MNVLDEIVLPDSNTGAACEEFLKRAEPWFRRSHAPVQVDVYGDSTGDARRSSASRTDWQWVREFLAGYREFNPDFRWLFNSYYNPPVRDG